MDGKGLTVGHSIIDKGVHFEGKYAIGVSFLKMKKIKNGTLVNTYFSWYADRDILDCFQKIEYF
jgi:hypothetical protein